MASSRYRKIKVGSIRRKKTISFLIAISLLFISGGYSYLNSELGVSGTLNVNQYISKDNVRIANIELIDKKNNGNEKDSSQYSSNLTAMYVSLPNINSSVTYRVTIKNNTDYFFTPGEIKIKTNTNSNVKYTIDGLKSYDVYQGSIYTFNITFTTSIANQECNLVLGYDFKAITNTIWNFDYTGGEQTFSVQYNGTYKLETWGASGNVTDVSNVTIGYGGYSKGEITLNNGSILNIVVGGAGQSAIGNGVFAIGTGGYNGGGYGKDYKDARGAGGGGGATHIATVTGLLANLESHKGTYSDSNGTYDSKDILIVAGGGGGVGNFNGKYANINMTGGTGGGFTGGTGISPHLGSGVNLFLGYGGTQSAVGLYETPSGFVCGNYCGSEGSFGRGGNCDPAPEGNCSGGGGGFYGGSFNTNYSGSGGGGSGYIGSSLLKNKAMYGYGVEESSAVHTKTININTANSTPLENTAKIGNGYARITLLPNN